MSNLTGTITINKGYYKSDDYMSCLSVRVVENLFTVNGNLTLFTVNNTEMVNHDYKGEAFVDMNSFMQAFNQYFVNYAVMSIVNNLFVLTFAVAVDDGVFVYTGNVGTFLGASGGAIEATTVLTSSILSLKYMKIKCDKLSCSLQTYDINGKLKFDTNVL